MNAANDFEKDFFKLMINSVYGKTMEKKFTKNNQCESNKQRKSFAKRTSRLTHITHKVFNKNCDAIHKTKQVLIYNKPIYVWFTALRLSKWKIYNSIRTLVKELLMPSCYLLAQTNLLIK